MIKINNIEVKNIKFNGNTVDNVLYNNNLIYTSASFIINFDSNGGNEPSSTSIEIKKDEQINIPTCTKNSQGTVNTVGYSTYELLGWYDQPTNGNKILEASGTTIIPDSELYNRILYAHWKEKKINKVNPDISVYPTRVMYKSAKYQRISLRNGRIKSIGGDNWYGNMDHWMNRGEEYTNGIGKVKINNDGSSILFVHANASSSLGIQCTELYLNWMEYTYSGYNSKSINNGADRVGKVQNITTSFQTLYSIPKETLTPVNRYEYTYTNINDI